MNYLRDRTWKHGPAALLVAALSACATTQPSNLERVSDDPMGPPPSQTVVVDVPPAASKAGTAGSSQREEVPFDPPPEDTSHCDPLPDVGSPCLSTQRYCVVDWGSPGGHSTALWCQDGTWHRIEETNLQ